VKFEMDRIRISLCSVHVDCLRGRSEVSTCVVKRSVSPRNRCLALLENIHTI